VGWTQRQEAPHCRLAYTCKNCSYVCAYNCVVHSTALNISDNLPSYPPDNHHSSDVCAYNCVTIVVHSTALNISDNLPSYPPDNHHSSDGVYRRAGADALLEIIQLRCYGKITDSQRNCTNNYINANRCSRNKVFQQTINTQTVVSSVTHWLEEGLYPQGQRLPTCPCKM